MWIKYILLSFLGLCAGGLLSAGFFALITSLGIVNALSAKTGTASKILTYETAIIFGACSGNLVWGLLFTQGMLSGIAGYLLLTVFGLFYGIFTGNLIMSLAEATKAVPIFFRRTKIRAGLGILVIALAAGKCLGNLLYAFLI